MTTTDISPWTMRKNGYTEEQIWEVEQELEAQGCHLFDWASWAWIRGYPCQYVTRPHSLVSRTTSFRDWEDDIRVEYDIPASMSVMGVLELLRPVQKQAMLLKYRDGMTPTAAAARMRCTLRVYNNALGDASASIRRQVHPADYAKERASLMDSLGVALQLEVRDPKRIREMFGRLSSIQRIVVKSVAVEGKSHEVVAGELGVPVYDVSRDYNKAVAAMRKGCLMDKSDSWDVKMLADCGIPAGPDVAKLMHHLPDMHRRLLLSCYRDGEQLKDMAVRLGRSQSFISYNMTNAKRYMHTIYKTLKDEREPPTEWFRGILVKIGVPVTDTTLKAWCSLDYSAYKELRLRGLNPSITRNLKKVCKHLEDMNNDD